MKLFLQIRIKFNLYHFHFITIAKNTGVCHMDRKITIIVPCYNVEAYLDRCIQSLLDQTIGFSNLEVIFINDASTDGSINILRKYEERYPDNIMLIDLPVNNKQGAARNIGLQYATSDYIAFVDADDWVESTMYEKLYQRAIEYNCDMVCCKYKRVADETEAMGLTGYEDGFYHIQTAADRKAFVLDGIEGGICCNIYKRQIILENNILFPEGMSYEDNFWLPLLQLYIQKFYVVEEYLYHYYINLNSTITKRDSFHHFDRLLIELMKLEEYKSRGFYSSFQDEFELQFLRIYFLNTLNILFTRFTIIPSEIFYEMQKTVKICFPHYKENKYISDRLNESEIHMLLLIESRCTPDQLEEIAFNYRHGYLYIP